MIQGQDNNPVLRIHLDKKVDNTAMSNKLKTEEEAMFVIPVANNYEPNTEGLLETEGLKLRQQLLLN